jgi:hypothetical protein
MCTPGVSIRCRPSNPLGGAPLRSTLVYREGNSRVECLETHSESGIERSIGPRDRHLSGPISARFRISQFPSAIEQGAFHLSDRSASGRQTLHWSLYQFATSLDRPNGNERLNAPFVDQKHFRAAFKQADSREALWVWADAHRGHGRQLLATGPVGIRGSRCLCRGPANGSSRPCRAYKTAPLRARTCAGHRTAKPSNRRSCNRPPAPVPAR